MTFAAIHRERGIVVAADDPRVVCERVRYAGLAKQVTLAVIERLPRELVKTIADGCITTYVYADAGQRRRR